MATKQSLYFPEEMLREIMRESVRLDRSLSWTVQQAWRVARSELSKVASPAQAFAPPASGGESSPRRSARPEERAPSSQVLEFLKGKFEHAAQ